MQPIMGSVYHNSRFKKTENQDVINVQTFSFNLSRDLNRVVIPNTKLL